jgi:hypothetical protein
MLAVRSGYQVLRSLLLDLRPRDAIAAAAIACAWAEGEVVSDAVEPAR